MTAIDEAGLDEVGLFKVTSSILFVMFCGYGIIKRNTSVAVSKIYKALISLRLPVVLFEFAIN